MNENCMSMVSDFVCNFQLSLITMASVFKHLMILLIIIITFNLYSPNLFFRKQSPYKTISLPRPSTRNMTTTVLDRAIGCLYGQAIGDALGTRYEFTSFDEAIELIEKDTRTDDLFLPILGGGPFDMECGQVTDDTEMAMGLARSLLRRGGYDAEDVACAYEDWYQSNPPDMGTTTLRALSYVNRAGGDVYGQMVDNSNRLNGDSKSNGCLMRISPLAIDAMTKECVLVYTTALIALIRGANNQEAYELAIQTATDPEVRKLLMSAADPTPEEGSEKAGGYVGTGLMLAFRHLLQTDSLETALILTNRMGGDTDTNGCIVGAMMGAYHGWQNIPEEWRVTVVNAKPERLEKYPVVALSDLEEVAKQLLLLTVPLDKTGNEKYSP